MTAANANDVSGHCLCGAVAFSGRAAISDVHVCHCSMCQRWSSGPLLMLECDPKSLKVSGEEFLEAYASSEWGERCFCKKCGSVLMWRARDNSHLVVSAGALEDRGGLKLATQIFIDEKPAYYDFANETPRMTGAEFVAMLTAGVKKD